MTLLEKLRSMDVVKERYITYRLFHQGEQEVICVYDKEGNFLDFLMPTELWSDEQGAMA